MKRRYRVVVIGMGKRGMHHADAFKENGRFELVGICDTDQQRLEEASAKLGVAVSGTDARQVACKVKPDIFCFCTPPQTRARMIEIGVETEAKMIAMEKPIALSSAEGVVIRGLLTSKRVRAVVSHQHRFGAHYQQVKRIVASGELGRLHTVYGTATGWMMHMLSHLVDYMCWFNENKSANWVMAQASGRQKLSDVHPSPDYIAGFIQFSNGVRGIVECGAGAPDVPEVDYWWQKCRIGAQGTDGFAEVLTGGGWRSVTRHGAEFGPGVMNYENDMRPYVQGIANWLDDDRQVHPCNFDDAYSGFEIMMAMCRSVVQRGQISLPLDSEMDEINMLRDSLPFKSTLISSPTNLKAYGS